MKKTAALLLVFVMVLALCGCGNNDGSSNVTVIPNDNPITVKRDIGGNDLAEELSEPVGDENIQIEACKTTYVERDTYTQMRMNVKVRNLTEYNPPDVNISLQYTTIDKNGDALHETYGLGNTDIALSGTAQWFEAIYSEDGGAGIRVFGYQIFGGDVNIDVDFDTPIDLYCEDYKITYDEIKGTGS